MESKITDKSPSLSDLRSVALCLIGYAGFFRFRELCRIKAFDVKFFPFNVSFYPESSKCDQFRDGAWTVIARSDLPTCPVKALEDYISAAQINFSRLYRCSGPLLPLGQKMKYEAKGLPIQELENSLRTPLKMLLTFQRLAFI